MRDAISTKCYAIESYSYAAGTPATGNQELCAATTAAAVGRRNSRQFCVAVAAIATLVAVFSAIKGRSASDMMAYKLLGLAFILPAAGTVLGMVSMFQRRRYRGLPIAGLAINLLLGLFVLLIDDALAAARAIEVEENRSTNCRITKTLQWTIRHAAHSRPARVDWLGFNNVLNQLALSNRKPSHKVNHQAPDAFSPSMPGWMREHVRKMWSR